MDTQVYNIYTLTRFIEKWAVDRNLIAGSSRQAQTVKLMEELGELASGIARGNEIAILDSIGDCFVVLTILAQQSNSTIDECVAHAYNEIKDRRGKMIDGIFVREGE